MILFVPLRQLSDMVYYKWCDIRIILFLFIFSFELAAQDISRYNVEFSDQEKIFANPMTGGFEAPQFQDRLKF